MLVRLRAVAVASFLGAAVPLACSGGDGDAKDAGDGDSPGDGDGDTTGDGDGSSGDGDTTGDGDGDGSTGDGDASQTGVCFDESCAGDCAPAIGGPHCNAVWECLQVLLCTNDLAEYCGCDGETFQASGTCAPFAYAHRGPCDGGIAGGLNCDHSHVVTDDLPPECEAGKIPQVVDRGWGNCVELSECGCDVPGSQEQCGNGLSYICHQNNRCGDLLN